MSDDAPANLNPFPGLRPFTQEEDYLFFGREEQTLELLQRLGSHRLVAVVGTSGSGKSSLVRCGLLSELLGGRMLGAGAAWEVAVTHPGGNPLALLTDALLEADLYDREEEHARENLLATLSRSHLGLVEAVKQAGLGADTNFLLVVDQFEEVFRFQEAGQRQQEAANEFVSLLLEAAAQREVPVYVVLTMRSDFIGECGQFEGLAEMVSRGEFLIPRLTREQYKRVIEGPVKVAGGRIAPRLLQRLLNDLGQQADQLPCLQHAMMRTWDVWAGEGKAEALDLDDYQRVGRMSQALSLHADEVYASLADDRQRELCRGVFQALTVEESSGRGIRRPQRLGRLCQILEVPAEELRPVIDAYRHGGVTFLMPAPEVELTDSTIVDISHESLMRVWTRLRQWVEEETQAAGIYHRLSESADLHAQGKAGLYRDPELGIALAWRDAKRPNAAWAERYRPGFATAVAFLDASREASLADEQAREAAQRHELEQAQELAEARRLRLEHQHRAARRLRTLIAGLAVVALVAGLACVFALLANRRANMLAERARDNEEQATESARVAKQSQEETAKVLAVVASQKAEVEGSLRKAEAAEEAGRRLLYTTDMQSAPFVWRDDRATAERLRSLLAKHIPDGAADGGNDRAAAAVAKPDLRGFEWHYYQHLLDNSATVFSGHETPVAAAAFVGDGQLLTLDQDCQVRRWDLGSRDEDASARRDLAAGRSARARALSPDGRRAALTASGEVRVFDTATGAQTFKVSSPNSWVSFLAFSRDDERLVILDDKLRWFDAVSGELIASFDVAQTRAASIALSADGLTVVVAGRGPSGQFVDVFRLDPAAKKVTPLAQNRSFGGTLEACAVSPDGGRFAVAASLAASLFIVTAEGQPIAYHGSVHASPISSMAFSADGTRLATADTDGTIKTWDQVDKLTSKSTASSTLKGHRGAVTSIRFAQDGKRLATTGADKTARVWDLAGTGAAARTLADSDNAGAVDARFSPDGRLVAMAELAGTGGVRLWDAASGELVRTLPAGDRGRAASVAFSPTDHRMLAVGYAAQAGAPLVVLWDVDAGTEVARLTDAPSGATAEPIGALAFSPDGKLLVAGRGAKNLFNAPGVPQPLLVWEVATRRPVRRLSGHTGSCLFLCFSHDGNTLASGSRDGTVILWSTPTWKAAHTLRNPDADTLSKPEWPGMVEAVALSPDGRTCAMASREGGVHLWDVAGGTLLASLRGHSGSVAAVAFSPDGRTLASGGGDQTVRLWNVEARRELMQLDPGGVDVQEARTLAFSPDGGQLLAGGQGTAVWSTAPVIWNDAERSADALGSLLRTGADFQSRVRMLSENLQLHAGLEKLETDDARVRAALAAAQANWHASRKAWPEAVAAFDRLASADPTAPDGWLRTPGLLRVATALLYEGRPRDAAMLLSGGAERRAFDGLSAAVERAGIGLGFSITEEAQAKVDAVLAASPASRSALVPGDVILKVGDTELTRESQDAWVELQSGKAGSSVRLTVRHAGREQPEVIELTRETFVNDAATGVLLHPLRDAINERLAKTPGEPGLLELRAELAGQWSGTKSQLADYTAAIDALAAQVAGGDAGGDESAHLGRLYGRRGDAYLALRQWQRAADDYGRGVTDATADDPLLSNQALARAETLLGVDALVPTSERERTQWRVTLEKPGDDWAQPGFEDSKWIPAPGPFGTADIKLSRSRWNTPDLWLRHDFEFEQPGGAVESRLRLRVVCDDSAEVFLNGKLLGRQGEHTKEQYVILELDPGARDLLVPGTNTLAVHCNNVGASIGVIDVGLYSVLDGPAALVARRLAAGEVTDPWAKLATAHHIRGERQAVDELVAKRPKLAGVVGDACVRDEEKDWARAVEIYTVGVTAQPTDLDLLAKRALAHEALKDWDAAAADWSRAAAAGNPDGAKLLGDFARRLAAAGGDQGAPAQHQFEASQALYEQLLAADPENDLLVPELAQLLLDRNAHESRLEWTVLRPTGVTSQLGATLTPQDDGSVLASGTNTDGDVYTISAVSELERVAAVRLDVLPDDSLPSKGSGRHPSGNFHLRGFQLFQAGEGEGARTPVPLERAWASYEWAASNVAVAGAIDQSLQKFWHVWMRTGEPHHAIFTLREPVAAKGQPFVVELRQGHPLGRFRLSFCADREALEREEDRAAVAKAADPWLRLGAAFAMNGRPDEAFRYANRALDRAAGAEARKPVVELVGRFDDLLARLVARQPDDSQLQLAMARALGKRGRRHLDANQPAQAQAKLHKARETLARLRAGRQWSVLTPTELTSAGGEQFTVEGDGSVFVSGPTSDRAVYTLKLRTDLPTLTAIRLESIPDARLPAGGAGRFGNGNFHVAGVSVASGSGAAARPSKPIGISAVIADTHQTGNQAPAKMIDNDPRTWWEAYPEIGKTHWAVFAFASPANVEAGSVIVTLDSGITEWGKHGLGRFRLFATGEADALERARVIGDIKDAELVDLGVALAKAHARQGQTAQAVAAFAETLALTGDRADNAKLIAEAASLDGVLDPLAERAADDAGFQAELARHALDLGRSGTAAAALAKARTLVKAALEKAPEDTVLASDLADLLLIDPARWTIVKPAEVKSEGGASLSALPDDSILASGKNPLGDVYTIVAEPGTTRVTAIRLEALTHESLPNLGPGRDEAKDRGNFDMVSWGVRALAAAGGTHAITLSEATADYAQFPITVGHWNTGGGSSKSHSAYFRVEQPGDLPPQARLEFRLQFSNNAEWPRQNLGRFRLSVSDHPDAFDQERRRLAMLKLTDPWAKLAAAYRAAGDEAALAQLLARHPGAVAGLGSLYALAQDWAGAVAEYTRMIGPDTKDAKLFAARAEAHEKLEHWALAAADWGDADRLDRTAEYGDPSVPAMERRFQVHGRLQQWDKQILDCDELLKPERLGADPWVFVKRAETYDKMRKWDEARADHDRAIAASSPDERGPVQSCRARHFANQGLWQEAADDLRQIYKRPTGFLNDWWAFRDAALIYATAGDAEQYRQAAAACYGKRVPGDPYPEDNKWIVLAMVLSPGMVTDETRPRLLELAGKAAPDAQARLAAAVHFRGGDDKRAADMFDASGLGGSQFSFLAAMAHQKLGNGERARQLLAEGSAWVRERRSADPGIAVPQGVSWQDWSLVRSLQNEASDSILGGAPELDAARALALEGQTRQAADAYAKALLEAADDAARARVMTDLAHLPDVLAAAHESVGDDPQARKAFLRTVETVAGPNATATIEILAALSQRRRGEEDQARLTLGKAAAAMQPIGGNSLVRGLARQALQQFGADGPDATAILAALAGAAPAELTKAIENQPESAAAYLARGEWYGRRGAWRKAADDFTAAYRLAPDAMAGMQLGILLASLGETERYREHCREQSARFVSTGDTLEAERTLKACCLRGPEPVGDPKRLARLAEVGSRGDASEPIFVWLDLAKALYEYRLGRFADAVATSRANRERIKTLGAADAAVAAVTAIEAMALYRADDAAGARASLADSKKLIDEKLLTRLSGDLENDWQNWLAAQLLYREAESLLRLGVDGAER